MNDKFQPLVKPGLLDKPQDLLNNVDTVNRIQDLSKIPANAAELEAAVPQKRPPRPYIPTPPMPDPPPEPSIPLHPLPLPSSRTSLDYLDDQRRLFRLYSALPADHRLYLETLSGSEAFNEPFEFELGLVSLNTEIELKEVLNKPLTVGIQQSDGSERYFNGYVATFAFESAHDRWANYSAQLVSWLHFLSLRVNCRIYQNISVRQILKQVFSDYLGTADYEFNLREDYEPQEFIVQYQESDLHFISRLIEKEGWSTYFVHRFDGHRLVITDDTVMDCYCPPLDLYSEIEYNAGQERVGKDNTIYRLRAERRLQPTKVTLNTFDYEDPLGLRGVAATSLAQQGDVARVEVFDGKPNRAYNSWAEGAHYARRRLEGYEARAKFFAGESDCPELGVGRTTLVKNHPWLVSIMELLRTRSLPSIKHLGMNLYL